MFTEMLTSLQRGEAVDLQLLAKRFDIAMTKKLGTVKLPSAFWSADPKINPRVDHLLLAAIVLDDAERVGLAVSAFAAECVEKLEYRPFEEILRQVLEEMLADMPAATRATLHRNAARLLL
jgi:hypothetical protein